MNNLQVYSTFDDGIELFGGAVNVSNYVALYARDDSIDIDSGYRGTISNALVIQSNTDANRCIEADGIDGFSGREASAPGLIAQGLNAQPTISNLTCVLAADNAAGNTHDPSQGWRLREGISPTITNSMVLGTFEAKEDPAEDNWCVRFDNYDLVQTSASISGVIFACHDNIDERDGFTEAVATGLGNQFAAASGDAAVSASAVSDTGLVVVEGQPPIVSIADATKVVDGAATTATTTAGEVIGTTFTLADLSWTFGILDGSRAQALWFDAL